MVIQVTLHSLLCFVSDLEVSTIFSTVSTPWIYIIARVCWWGPNKDTLVRFHTIQPLTRFKQVSIRSMVWKCPIYSDILGYHKRILGALCNSWMNRVDRLERSYFVSQFVLLSTECRILNVDRKSQESKFITLRGSYSTRTTSVISKYPECRLWQVSYVQ